MVTRKFRFDSGDAAWLEPAAAPMRAADVDLDQVYSPDPIAFRDRVDQLVKRVRALGVTSLKRSALAPDIPTIDESGLRGFELEQFYSIVAPAGTPP